MLGIFFDSEMSGLNLLNHNLLELAFKIVDLRTGELKEAYQSVIACSLEDWERHDPASVRVNGFTWEEVERGQQIERVAEQVVALFSHWKVRHKKAVFICQNPSLDRMFFCQVVPIDHQEMHHWPYHWFDLASMFWALSLKRAREEQTPLPWEIGFSKDAIAAHFNLPPEETPHRAMNGVDHLLLCYKEIVGFAS